MINTIQCNYYYYYDIDEQLAKVDNGVLGKRFTNHFVGVYMCH